MLKKVLAILITSLLITVVVVVFVLTKQQKEATFRSFSEQQTTLAKFSKDNVELGLSTGRLEAVKKILHELQAYSIFAGSIVYDDEMDPILTHPSEFEIPPEVSDEIGLENKVRHGKIIYEQDVLKDEDGEVIGTLLIAFTIRSPHGNQPGDGNQCQIVFRTGCGRLERR